MQSLKFRVVILLHYKYKHTFLFGSLASLIYSGNITNVVFSEKSTYYSVHINGYISPNQTDTYIFCLFSDNSATVYVNVAVFLSCAHNFAAQVGSFVLIAGS